jgi:hypothetical protein
MFEDINKQLAATAQALGEAVNTAFINGEQEIFKRIAEKVNEKGFNSENMKDHFDLGLNQLELNEANGLIVNQAYIVGDKETKKVLCAYRLEVIYTPQGILKDNQLHLSVNGRVEEVTKYFFYPEDDESLFEQE